MANIVSFSFLCGSGDWNKICYVLMFGFLSFCDYHRMNTEIVSLLFSSLSPNKNNQNKKKNLEI